MSLVVVAAAILVIAKETWSAYENFYDAILSAISSHTTVHYVRHRQ
jgi:hypothetical protein